MNFEVTPKLLKTLTLIAAAFMLLPLPVMQYIGEEGLTAIRSYEAFYTGDFLHSSYFGITTLYVPLLNFIAGSISNIIGWEYLDIGIRLVSVFASWGTALSVGLLARHLYPDHPQAPWLAALIYLCMGEVFFWYGWLGYADATFSFFVFSSISCLWVGLEKRQIKFLIGSVLLISIAYLVKNLTGIILLGLACVVLATRLKRWRFVFSPQFIITFSFVLLTPMAFSYFVVQSEGNFSATYLNAMRNFSGYGILDYLQHWFTYPFIFIFRALPVSLVIIWLWLRNKALFELNPTLYTLALVLLACFSPFWISAGGTPRYLVPLYGLVALLLTGLTLQLDRKHLTMVVKAVIIILVLKIPYSFAVLPYIKDWRPERDVKAVAMEIIQLTDDAPLRTLNDVSTGLAIAAYIDVWRQDRPPIYWYRDIDERGVYILAEEETSGLGRLIKTWQLRGDHVFLYRQP